MTIKPNTCPHCGTPLKSSRVCSWGTLEVYTCGKIFDDGPGAPCGNRDDRTTRDESTQPPEAEEPEAVQFQIELTEATVPAVVYPEVSTLPAIKPLADAALERLGLAVAVVEKLKGYGKLVLSDLTDKKAANDLDEKRKEVKRFRVAWTNACKEGRAEANAIADAWVKAQKTLVEDFEQVEDHLERQVSAHTSEVARIAREAEQARQAKIQGRLDAMSAAGIPVDLVRATELSDEAWDEYLGRALDAKAKLDAAAKVAEELTAMGDECTAGEVLQLTDEQIEHRLGVARRDDFNRKETARIHREQDEANWKRLETGALRVRELALLGAPADLDTLADMTPEAYAVALEAATQDKADREKKVRDDADELERLRKLAAPKVEPVAEVVHAPDPEILPEVAAPATQIPEPADESALVRGICSTYDHETEPQKIAAWARAVLDGMPSTPAITSASLADRMVATVDGVRESLLALERAMGEA